MRNFAAVVAGLLVGSGVNMSLILLGSSLVPPPPGADLTTAEGLSAAMPLFEPRHFAVPFLAHALGTLTGALTAYLAAASHAHVWAFAIAAASLAGGIAAAQMIPAPAWFIVLDLLAAYLPMGWVGVVIGRGLKGFYASAALGADSRHGSRP